jgi:hypothetical protein
MKERGKGLLNPSFKIPPAGILTATQDRVATRDECNIGILSPSAFRSSIARPTDTSVYASLALAMLAARLKAKMESLSPLLWDSVVPNNMPVFIPALPGSRANLP